MPPASTLIDCTTTGAWAGHQRELAVGRERELAVALGKRTGSDVLEERRHLAFDAHEWGFTLGEERAQDEHLGEGLLVLDPPALLLLAAGEVLAPSEKRLPHPLGIGADRDDVSQSEKGFAVHDRF